MFVNTVVFRNRPQSGLSFRSFLEAVKQNCLGVYDHEDYPFERMARLNSSRPNNRNPLFDAMLSYENADERTFQIRDLRFSNRDLDLPTAMFDFSLEVIEEADALTLNFSYSTDLFSRQTVTRWTSYFRMILTGILADPAHAAAKTCGRGKRLLDSRRDRAEYPADKTLVDLFEN